VRGDAGSHALWQRIPVQRRASYHVRLAVVDVAEELRHLKLGKSAYPLGRDLTCTQHVVHRPVYPPFLPRVHCRMQPAEQATPPRFCLVLTGYVDHPPR
jgi:hypothetical protein